MCEQQFFGEYVLGWRGPSGFKATKGTIFHKVLEILAVIKKAQQDNINEIDDDIVGHIDTNKYNLNILIEKVYKHYEAAEPYHKWSVKDYKDCHAWVYKALEFNNGMFDPRNCDIVQPEQHFDITIKKPWSAFSYDTPDGKLEGYLALKGTIDLITRVDERTFEIVDYKGLPLDTPIPTPEGWTTMRELSIGDKVFDQKGKECKVTGKSEVKTKPCFKITFDDKNSVICDNEHRWSLSDGTVKCVTDLKINDKINVCKALECSKKQLPIEPYLLGLWLGDGRNRNAELTVGDKDVEILTTLINKGHEFGKMSKYRGRNVVQFTVLDTTHKLRKLGLLHNKHIPQIYLRSSVEQRLELLRGLMDSDGSVNTVRRQCVFTNCNEELIDDVKELALSLGQRVHKDTRVVHTNFKDNVTVHNLFFRPINNVVPFKLTRKLNSIDPNWGEGRSDVRKIIKISKVKKRQTQCIMVDSPDNTYLCTKNFIPTHNTGRRLDWATGQEKTQEKLEKDPQLRIYHYAVSNLYPEIDHIIFTIYFVNDGGPFSICFDKSDLAETEDMLRKKFEIVKNAKKPKLNRSWMCSKLCHFGKTTFENTNVLPIIEYRDNQITPVGKIMSKCEQLKYETELHGMKTVVESYKHPNHTFGKYKAPGSTE